MFKRTFEEFVKGTFDNGATNNKQQTTNNKQQTTNVRVSEIRVWQFELLRCIACFAVVSSHSISYLVQNEYYNYLGAVLVSASKIGVPLFVMISGYFLLSNSKNLDCEYCYRKRFKKIGIPLVFWSLFYALLYIVAPIKQYEALKNYCWYDWLFYGNPPCGYHLWYLYMLLGLYAATPFLLTIYKNYSTRVVLSICLLLHLIYIFQSRYIGSLFVILGAFGYMPYFIFGKYLGDKMLKEVFCQEKRKTIRIVSVTIFLISILLQGWLCSKFNPKVVLDRFFPLVILDSFCIYILFLSFRTRPTEKIMKALNWTSALTFGIYLVHITFLMFFNYVFYHRLGCEKTFLFCSITGILGLSTSIVATAILKKIPYLRECV